MRREPIVGRARRQPMNSCYMGKSLNGISLQGAIAYHEWLKEEYNSAHSVKLHVNIAKSLLSFALSFNYYESIDIQPYMR